MDQKKLTNEDVKAFLLNAYFGDVTDPLYTAVNSAYLDLNRTIEYKRAQLQMASFYDSESLYGKFPVNSERAAVSKANRPG